MKGDPDGPGSEWSNVHFDLAINKVKTGRAPGRNGVRAELYKYSLKTDVDGEGGVIDVKSDDGDGEFYKMGAKVTLVAKPADNFVFKEWSGEGIINTGSETNELTVSSNSSVTARFVPSDAK